jgi:hypothetical protein
MTSAKFEIETGPANVAERLRAIRFRLPGQAVTERIEMARVSYGPLYTIGLIQERIAETLPTRLFAKFWVVTPTYYWKSQIDPWIVAEVAGTMLCAVIARWDHA